MSRRCELTETSVQFGHNVSHSQRKTAKKFKPNLQVVTAKSDILNQKFTFKISTRALKTIDLKGGLDNFLISAKMSNLSPKARSVKVRVTLAKSKKTPA